MSSTSSRSVNAGSIDKLPYEILSSIFRTCIDTGFHPPATYIHPNNGALTISHVCTRWREIATSTPTLWNDVDSRRNVPLNALFLQRCGSLPLCVRAELTCSTEFCNLLEDYMSRIHEIRTPDPEDRIYFNNEISAFTSLITCPRALCLRVLVCSFITTRHNWPRRPPLFDINTHPHITVLQMEHFGVMVDPRLTQNFKTSLTHLSVWQSDMVGNAFWPNLLNVLQHSPMLEHLDITAIDGTGHNSLNLQHGESSRIRLSHLKYLNLWDSPNTGFPSLLALLVFPRDAILRLRQSWQDPDPRGLFSLFPREGFTGFEHLQDMSVVHIEQFHDDEDGPIKMTCGGDTSAFHTHLDSERFRGCYVLCNTLTTFRQPLAQQAVQIRELWLGPELEGFWDTAIYKPWQSFFAALSSLELLALPFEMGRDHIRDALTEKPFLDDSIPCLRLQTIHAFIVEYEFADNLAEHDLDTIDGLLKRRFELGYPVHNLHLHVRNVSFERLSMFHPKPSIWVANNMGHASTAVGKPITDSSRKYPYASEVTFDALEQEILDSVGGIAAVRARIAQGVPGPFLSTPWPDKS